MKTLKQVVAFILLMGIYCGVEAQTGSPQEMVVPLSDPGKPVVLKAHLMRGQLKVIGYEGKEVRVEVYLDSTREHRDDDNDDDVSKGMKRIGSTGGLDVRAEENDNTVEVESGMMTQKLAGMTIKVPQNTARIDVGTTIGGNVTISNVSGKIEVSSPNGSITITDVSGSVVANTVNGSIVVKFKSVDANAAMAFSTFNGKIDVTLPADAKANLKLKTGRGSMYTDFDIAVDKTQPKLETKNEDHFHEVKFDDWVYGKINGGGPEFMMESQMGSIYIRKAK